ncbi:1-aminocyclopropane-1-carboxylate deaminase/D-cysteine desulfhydrase [Pedobacter puniceum]|uniref:Pyridoxal-phosphate dependent enzyme n=1 Tax=Pedobacter puniceum TaxID=2666136 RepID=A0A7K0FIZ8_9SPHI|nr:1-aminocyclopropane-1-carboxylate deaminase/D-cysteine desulfhydrase [Pedobacter puniceum]MRX45954.1 pyridoxal-phosphate dependent enzyme [Pedobacter puniceum]
MMLNLQFYSPEEEVFYPVFEQKNIRLFVKRDDLIHPFISGNKWRKLKYNLLKASANQQNHLVTFGGAYSNHLLATAAAGSKFGFKTTAFVRGEEVNNSLLSLCKIHGMHLIFTSRDAYKNKKQLFDEHFSHNPKAYFIDEGGAGKEAELGCREIITELKQNYDYIFCAAGTGTTSAGIINAIDLNKLDSIFVMVPVLKGGIFLKNDIEPLLINNSNYLLLDQYHFGGYAKTTPELIQFIKDFTSKTGILLDPVYTGKAMFAIQDLAQQDFFKANSKILMIHTGGIFGILGMLDKF